MNKIVASTVIAATTLIPALAAARDVGTHSFTREGQTYVYTSTMQHARQVIDGYSRADGSRFHLVVRNGMVSGISNGQPVRFRVSEASGTALVETAAR